MANQILVLHKGDNFMQDGSESEIANILSGLSALGYRNDALNEVLYECLVGPEFKETGEIQGEYDLYTLYTCISSFARLSPQTTKYYTDFAPKLHNLLSTIQKVPEDDFRKHPILLQMMVPDLSCYQNLWLCLATFAAL